MVSFSWYRGKVETLDACKHYIHTMWQRQQLFKTDPYGLGLLLVVVSPDRVVDKVVVVVVVVMVVALVS